METKLCKDCQLIKPITDFYPHPIAKDKLFPYCKPCNVKRGLAWRIKNKDKDMLSRKRYQEKNRSKVRMGNHNYLTKIRTIVFEHYGNKCSCPKCPETNPMFLTLDHINNDGAKSRKISRQALYFWAIKNNFPNNLILHCWNCNSGRYYRGNGTCPHLL